MLRITSDDSGEFAAVTSEAGARLPGDGRPRAVALRLEGRVAGPWVAILRQACAAVATEGGRLDALDLRGVDFADRAGIKLLRELAGRGITLRHSSLFIAKLLEDAEV